MSMSLANLFDADRQAVLRERLSRAVDLRDVADAIHDELAGFAHVDGPYVKGLTKSELPVALAILALVRESNGQVVESAPREPEVKRQGRKGERSGGNAKLGYSIVAVSAGIATVRATSQPICTILGASAAGIFLGAIGEIVSAALLGAGTTILFFGKTSVPGEPEAVPGGEPTVKLDTQKVCDGVLRLLGRIDDLVRAFGDARAERAPERPPATLADFPEFLRLFQLMWSAVMSDSKDEMVAIVQRQFPSLLRGQGVEVVRLGDDALQADPVDDGLMKMCEMDYSGDVKAPTLDYPPIRAKDTVILKGRVVLPAPCNVNK